MTESGAIDVWLARTDVPPGVLARLHGVLDSAERERAASFRFEDDRARSIVARAALRHLLALRLGRDPRELRFALGENGKPALAAGELEFNVSHSGERVAIAIAAGTAVGVDIERERPRRNPVALARRFFAPAEAAEVVRDAARFFPIWTAKESVIKALGTGLATDLRSFEAFASPSRFEPVTNLDGWFVTALPLDDGYAGALCARGDHWRITMREWSAGG